MKSTKTLVAVALATAGLALGSQVHAQAGHTGGGHWSGGGHTGGGHWSGGGTGGHWSGGDHWSGGGHWRGGHWRGGHFFGPRFGLFIGAPLLWSPWYWGYPYDYYYPRTVIYREVERVPEAVYEEEAPPTTEVPPMQGGPMRAPAYMNYCASAKAYFPKVTSCPEGWRFEPAR